MGARLTRGCSLCGVRKNRGGSWHAVLVVPRAAVRRGPPGAAGRWLPFSVLLGPGNALNGRLAAALRVVGRRFCARRRASMHTRSRARLHSPPGRPWKEHPFENEKLRLGVWRNWLQAP